MGSGHDGALIVPVSEVNKALVDFPHVSGNRKVNKDVLMNLTQSRWGGCKTNLVPEIEDS